MVRIISPELEMRSWHRTQIQQKIADTVGATKNSSSIAVLGIAKVPEELLEKTNKAELIGIGLTSIVKCIANDDGSVEIAVLGHFETELNRAIFAARRLRDFFNTESILGFLPSVSLARHTYASICGLERCQFPMIYFDSNIAISDLEWQQMSSEFSKGWNKASLALAVEKILEGQNCQTAN